MDFVFLNGLCEPSDACKLSYMENHSSSMYWLYLAACLMQSGIAEGTIFKCPYMLAYLYSMHC